MAGSLDTTAFSEDFLAVMTRASAVVAVVASVAGTALTRDPRFVASFAAAAAADLACVRYMSRRGRAATGGPRAAVMAGVRLAGKAALLGAAAAFPAVLDLAGTAAGALVVDTTLLVAGPAYAAWLTFGPGSKEGGGGSWKRADTTRSRCTCATSR